MDDAGNSYNCGFDGINICVTYSVGGDDLNHCEILTTYIGCYKDLPTSPLPSDDSWTHQQYPNMAFPIPNVDTTYQSPANCANKAADAGSKYFGLEKGSVCW